MKNFYHYTMAMLCLKIAHLCVNNGRWFVWMDRSVTHIKKVKP